jgi:uroporphyrinogen-III synthase
MATLVSNYGGRPVSAPALREVPLESNTEALILIDGLVRGEFDLLVLLTGVGTRALLAVVDRLRDRAAFVAAVSGIRIAARGPKPLAVLRELGLSPWVVASEPNTWRDLLAAIDAKAERGLAGSRVAVQEYGVSNPELLAGLRARGAQVTSVPVYRWALPEDLEPLRYAVRSIAAGEIDVAIFTTATQVVHLLQMAGDLGLRTELLEGLASMAVASIGPTTSEELREQGIGIDIEASHPKMGFLVREAAEQAAAVLQAKRPGGELR